MLKCGLTLLIRLTKVAANKRKRAKMRNENVMKGGDEFDKSESMAAIKIRIQTTAANSNFDIKPQREK